MAERRPPGFNVPLGFYDGPEVNSIPRRIRAAAVGVWTLCGAFSANKLQDGYVGPEMLKQLGCTDAIRAALKATRGPDGEPDPLWIDARDGGIQFTKWSTYQRSRAEVKAYRKADAERKKAERDAAKQAVTSADSKMSGRTSNGHPPDYRDPSTKTESLSLVTTGVSGPVGHQLGPPKTHTARPSEFCDRHPGGTRDRCGDCGNARRAANAWDQARTEQDNLDAIARVNERRQELDRLHRCKRCDPAGWLLDPETREPVEPATRCTHPTPIGAKP